MVTRLLHGPPSLLGTPHLSRGPLVPMGPQDLGRLRADVSPLLTQDHRDVAAMPQTQGCAKNRAGCPPWALGRRGTRVRCYSW